MTTTPDRIDLQATLTITVDRAWELIGEPGWFVNEGRLSAHTLDWTDERHVTVTDPDHGSVTFEVVSREEPTRMTLRGLDADGRGGSRIVEFRISPSPEGATIRVVESGFASMNVPDAEKLAQHEQNTRTWQRQLDLARDLLESDRHVSGR